MIKDTDYIKIESIFKKHLILEPFQKLVTKGIANTIYATKNYILRIPTDHIEAKSDALTESIAAPIAYMHGIKTPKMICFDQSFDIIDTSYSLWERIHGETLGELPNFETYHQTWFELGYEIAKIHVTITSCEDPNAWLDQNERPYTKTDLLKALNTKNYKSTYLLNLINETYNEMNPAVKKRFTHGDVHLYNVLCTKDDQFLSIIDWGDAGWADPTLDFYMLPYQVLTYVLKGYQSYQKNLIDQNFVHQIILDQIWKSIEEKENVINIEHNIQKLTDNLLLVLK